MTGVVPAARGPGRGSHGSWGPGGGDKTLLTYVEHYHMAAETRGFKLHVEVEIKSSIFVSSNSRKTFLQTWELRFNLDFLCGFILHVHRHF